MKVITQLLFMMFLQYFVQGMWNMTLGAVLASVGMVASIGTSYALLGLATIISPLFIGMLADRFIAAQKLISGLLIGNALLLYQLPAILTDRKISIYFVLIFCIGLLYYPTTALSNSIAFRHLNDNHSFPMIRVMGNIGFISAGLIIGYYGIFNQLIVFKLAAVASALYGLYCLSLPNTPPAAAKTSFNWRTVLCLDVLKLFKDPYFSLFMFITLLVMTAKTAYNAYIPVFLQDFGFNPANMMQIGVASEVFFMLILGGILKKWGFKTVLAIGITAWVIRSAIFALAASVSTPLGYILFGLVLQGICWTGFFTAGDIYINSKAQDTIRSQVQSLRLIFSNGLGVLLSANIVNTIYHHVTTQQNEKWQQWAEFWQYPALITAVALVIFILCFHDKSR